jgi:hypothetical protein
MVRDARLAHRQDLAGDVATVRSLHPNLRKAERGMKKNLDSLNFDCALFESKSI